MKYSSLIVLITILTLVSCNDIQSPPQKSETGAQQVNIKALYQIPTNAKGLTAEQNQILERIRVTNDPKKILWMHILSLDGRIIYRTPVRGKVTSSGKRLQPTHMSGNGLMISSQDLGGINSWIFTDELIQPDGTYGESDHYIFWFDMYGRYFQYGNGYLLTDFPINLEDPIDKITGLYNVQEAAAKWQKEQELKLQTN